LHKWSKPVEKRPSGAKAPDFCAFHGTTEQLAEKVRLAAWRKGPWLKPHWIEEPYSGG
jgi:hypothetical protein